jgi:hypothetical protein
VEKKAEPAEPAKDASPAAPASAASDSPKPAASLSQEQSLPQQVQSAKLDIPRGLEDTVPGGRNERAFSEKEILQVTQAADYSQTVRTEGEPERVITSIPKTRKSSYSGSAEGDRGTAPDGPSLAAASQYLASEIVYEQTPVPSFQRAFAPTPVEDPWIEHLNRNSRENVVAQLRASSSLRKNLRVRLGEMNESKGSQKEQNLALVNFMEKALTESESTGAQSLVNLSPLTPREAFLLDPEETRQGVTRLIAEFGEADAQYQPQESLFTRITKAHRRYQKDQKNASGARSGGVRITREQSPRGDRLNPL